MHLVAQVAPDGGTGSAPGPLAEFAAARVMIDYLKQKVHCCSASRPPAMPSHRRPAGAQPPAAALGRVPWPVSCPAACAASDPSTFPAAVA